MDVNYIEIIIEFLRTTSSKSTLSSGNKKESQGKSLNLELVIASDGFEESCKKASRAILSLMENVFDFNFSEIIEISHKVAFNSPENGKRISMHDIITEQEIN